MAADNEYIAERGSAMGGEVRVAAVIGLDEVAAETATLFLEIVGWAVVTVDAIEALPKRAYRLVIVEESLFARRSAGVTSHYADWQNIVFVGSQLSKSFTGVDDAKIHYASLPVDVAELEAIVAALS